MLPHWHSAPPPDRPSIVFILMDDLRWDEVDYAFVSVPNIQRIARQGVRCNRKTVYHHLKRQAWLASHRHRTQRPGRRHEGKAAVLQSNQRWACDITTFKLWNQEKLRLTVSNKLRGLVNVSFQRDRRVGGFLLQFVPRTLLTAAQFAQLLLA